MELKKTLQTKVQYDHKIKDAMTKDETKGEDEDKSSGDTKTEDGKKGEDKDKSSGDPKTKDGKGGEDKNDTKTQDGDSSPFIQT